MDEPVLGAGHEDEGFRSQDQDLVDHEARAQVPADGVAQARVGVEAEAGQEEQVQEAAPGRQVSAGAAGMPHLPGQQVSHDSEGSRRCSLPPICTRGPCPTCRARSVA